MKKILLTALLPFAVIIACMVHAANYTAPTFIDGISMMVSNSQTITYGGTNTYFTNRTGQPAWSGQTNGANSDLTYPFVVNDVQLSALADGSLNTNLLFVMRAQGVVTNQTNIIVYTFVKGQGTNFGTNNVYDQWVVNQNVTNTVESCVTTNPPIWFLQGADKIRLQTCVSSNQSGGSNVVIKQLRAGFWVP